jgi:sugar/nucleoside kinase (ribokinase family)
MTQDYVFDVLGLGCVAVDDLLYVATYPPADAKARVLRRERQCGGLTATALVTAARLGSQCGYAGVLGYDPLSTFVAERLIAEGIDITHLVRRCDASPIHSTIIIDTECQSRTIFFDLAGVIGADTDQPPPALIRSSRVLLVDPCGVDGMLRATRIARSGQIPVVADIEGDMSLRAMELLEVADHLIVSHATALDVTGESDPARATARLWTEERTAVVVTCGQEGGWYLTSEQSEPWHYPAFAVPSLDTTGCGDVFHGAYASALARGLSMLERLRVAAATAALKAMTLGGQTGIPTRSSVDAFLREQSPWHQ